MRPGPFRSRLTLLGAALAIAVGASLARAEEPAPSAAPALTLSGVTETLPHGWLHLVEPFTSQYWLRSPDGLAPFRYAPELRLRLDFETYRARWGPLVLSTSLELAPPGEGSMPAQLPGASARVSDSHGLPSSSGVLELRLPVGDVGLLTETGLFMRTGVPSGRPSTREGFVHFGWYGKF